jgi:hypothetical protein
MSTISDKFYSGGNGIPYTKEITGTPHTDIANNTYFKDLSDGLVYFKNAGGAVISMFESSGIASGVIHVDITGDDAAAAATPYSSATPFATPVAAANAATVGDLIVVNPNNAGTPDYAIGANLARDGVNWYLHPGVVFTCITIPFDILVTFTIGCNVYGHGKIVYTTGTCYLRRTPLPVVFEFDIIEGLCIYNLLADTTLGSSSSVRIIGHKYIDGANIDADIIGGFNAFVFDVTCPIIRRSGGGVSPPVKTCITAPNGSTYNIKCARIYSPSTAVALVGGSGSVSAGYIDSVSSVQSLCSLNVDKIVNLTINGGQLFHQGVVTNVIHGNYGFTRLGNVSTTLNASGGGELEATIGAGAVTSSFTSTRSLQVTLRTNVSNQVDYVAGTYTCNISGSGVRTKLVGEWRRSAVVFNVSNGILDMAAHYYVPSVGVITPFVLTGTGKMILSGSIDMAAVMSAVTLGATATFISNGGRIRMPDPYDTPSPIGLSASANMKVQMAGISTNYVGHVLTSLRQETSSFHVDAIGTTLTLNDGTNGAQTVVDGGAASTTLVRDALVADINTGANAALIDMSAYAHETDGDIFIVICDSGRTLTAGGPITNITETLIQNPVSAFTLTNLTGGPILQNIYVE